MLNAYGAEGVSGGVCNTIDVIERNERISRAQLSREEQGELVSVRDMYVQWVLLRQDENVAPSQEKNGENGRRMMRNGEEGDGFLEDSRRTGMLDDANHRLSNAVTSPFHGENQSLQQNVGWSTKHTPEMKSPFTSTEPTPKNEEKCVRTGLTLSTGKKEIGSSLPWTATDDSGVKTTAVEQPSLALSSSASPVITRGFPGVPTGIEKHRESSPFNAAPVLSRGSSLNNVPSPAWINANTQATTAFSAESKGKDKHTSNEEEEDWGDMGEW